MSAAHGRNAFDAIRLLAALTVIYSHAYVIGTPQSHILRPYGYDDCGSVAVSVFFAVSGYLVTKSWLADPHFPRFMARRLLRIYPALIGVVVVCFGVLGPWLTYLPRNEYFHRADAWGYLSNLSLFWQQKTLPGVFDHNPTTNTVNGPLWSLPYEFACYLVVGLCGALGLYRQRFGNLVLCLLFLITTVFISIHVGVDHTTDIAVLRNLRHIEAFFAASLLATGDLLAIEPLFLYPCLAVLAFSLFITTKLFYLLPVGIALVTLAAGRKGRLALPADYSYGLYVWGFVVQQALAGFFPHLDEAVFIVFSLVLSFIPAVVSWHSVEKPALKLKPARPIERLTEKS